MREEDWAKENSTGRKPLWRRPGGVFLDDSIFCQVAELHVTKGFPWANHCDVCAKALHARDVVSESETENKIMF